MSSIKMFLAIFALDFQCFMQLTDILSDCLSLPVQWFKEDKMWHELEASIHHQSPNAALTR